MDDVLNITIVTICAPPTTTSTAGKVVGGIVPWSPPP